MHVRHSNNNQDPVAVGEGIVFDGLLRMVHDDDHDVLPGIASVAVRQVTTATSADEVLDIDDLSLLFSSDNEAYATRTAALGAGTSDPAVIHLERWTSAQSVKVVVAAQSPERANEVLERLCARCSPLPVHEESVYVTFWSWSDHRGATARRREVAASAWDTIIDNYPGRTRAGLGALAARERPEVLPSGQLLLLHGPPGTGKTHAIRMLAREWRGWCDVHYVVDPEEFFGKAEYMLSVLVDAEGEQLLQAGGEATLPRWRLIVVEDTDELIRVDARRDTGQAMSRLLNLCDGLIGQGLRVLVLLTTNEEIGKLHPAIIRDGRCLANVCAHEFDAQEGAAWLSSHGLDGPTNGQRTLAELYALTRDDKQVATEPERAPAGFR